MTTPAELREKLRRDLERMKADPLDADAAFNFFVTAEHMLDWVHPGAKGRDARSNERKANVLLQVCSHIANGAKHFITESSHHRSVSGTREVGGYFPPAYFAPSYFPHGMFPHGNLVIQLDNEAANQLGAVIGAVDLAEKLMAYWDSQSLD